MNILRELNSFISLNFSEIFKNDILFFLQFIINTYYIQIQYNNNIQKIQLQVFDANKDGRLQLSEMAK